LSEHAELSMIKLKLTRVGACAGVVIPKEMLAKMNVREGDSLCAVEAPDGSYRLIPVPFDSFAVRPSIASEAKQSTGRGDALDCFASIAKSGMPDFEKRLAIDGTRERSDQAETV
jgi:bifunctional DNA-binding transcriptional regulator/antitoxin component of YhaV-PrlF toxin-antitoxin module